MNGMIGKNMINGAIGVFGKVVKDLEAGIQRCEAAVSKNEAAIAKAKAENVELTGYISKAEKVIDKVNDIIA